MAGSCSMPTIRWWRRSRDGCGRGSRLLHRSVRRTAVRRVVAPAPSADAAAAPTSCDRRRGSIEANGGAETEIVEVARGPDHDRWTGAPQRRQRAGRRRRGAGAGRLDRRGPRRPGRLRAERRPARPVGSTCSASAARCHRRLRPQRGRARGGARRGRGDRGRSRRAARRRSPRSSGPPATGRTTRSAGSAGSRRSSAQRVVDQGDAQVPARPDAPSRSSASCWRASNRRRRRRATFRSTRPKPARCRPS